MATQLLSTPSTHRWSLVGSLDAAWNSLRDAVIDTGFGPLAGLAEAAVVNHLNRMQHGQLVIETPSTTYTFPPPSTDPSTNKHAHVHARLRVVNPAFWIRLAFMSDLGFAEAYMYGDVECTTLPSLFLLFLLNKQALSSLNTRLSSLLSLPQHLLTNQRFLNTLTNARSNISAHYDISNKMFEGFLSKDMTYSCGIFADLDTDLDVDESILDPLSASSKMALSPAILKHHRDRRRIQGSQWSTVETDVVKAAANLLQQMTNMHGFSGISTPDDGDVDSDARTAVGSSPSSSPSPTRKSKSTHARTASASSLPSQEQQEQSQDHRKGIADLPGEQDELFASQLRKVHHIIRKANIQPHHRVLEIGSGWGALAIEAVRLTGCTVDTLTLSVAQKDSQRSAFDRWEWEGTFDRMVSVEMIEAVGKEFLEEYWRCVSWALKDKDAMGCVQVITIPEARFETYTKEVDFIRKWIFPGGFLPTVSYLVQTLTAGSNNTLVIDAISNIGPHYARTLREWRRRFEAKFDSVIVPALREEYPDVMGAHLGEKGEREIQVFKRKWIYYYVYCEIGFSTRTLGDHILTFTREGNADFGCDVYH
ncbi:related to cyclopropane-fatty-acyl-phospholipid synthase [Serendipita indica DSM 11827]|uniref:Related to cyclopropane-fatty-acyl-phospholipid synthase n=1 Tax=Serendipita indica (strain DSM 11827) TaxID=1109443 RepID=G4TNY6_SERID|nr:related to cyclopropane-fatty-acyl-phospholipid synthase [Serendipita indica DSM 11827]